MISLRNFNNNYPDYKIYIFRNLKDDICYVFEDSKFIAINKLEVLNKTYNNKIDLINEIFDDIAINNKFKENFKRFYISYKIQIQNINIKIKNIIILWNK